MTPNLRAFKNDVLVSEGVKQAAVADASSADDYNAALRKAEVAHWKRCVALAEKHDVTAPVYLDALAADAKRGGS